MGRGGVGGELLGWGLNGRGFAKNKASLSPLLTSLAFSGACGLLLRKWTQPGRKAFIPVGTQP